ncbi:ATP-dependent helicase [Sulfitobacter sp. R18_1]|uniref:ATP-dependent helicase n=1 Tax=Sulfitobacter sp. R18_1 TaxID=2821104 RepID=UPI001ADD4BE3|nr:ATP-dependent helicase [Sulfitobacter sp. R18_1]MBO9428516.1 ATP-dependent helicase [Sulfitobacter sp. R18_1]
MIDFDRLDADQLRAVTAPDGVTTVFAGAGTGKTTTLQARVAHLLQNGDVRPWEIVTVTFTNKSAKEIRERVEQGVGEAAHQIRMGTFHSLSLRILRKYPEAAGLQSSRFTILDDDEMKKLFEIAVDQSGVLGEFKEPAVPEGMSKEAYKALVKVEKKEFDANRKAFLKEALREVPRWKENGLHISEALKSTSTDPMQIDLLRVYEEYQDLLDMKNMVDFTDLLLRVVHLFDTHSDIAKHEAEKVRHMLVDEFQDTNMLQYRWLEHLTSAHQNMFVVGDTDQSLYSFRGSAPQIMERLAERTTCNVVLKTNRRCTNEILQHANMLVDINPRVEPKELKSERSGQPVKVVDAPNEFAEGNMVVTGVRDLLDSGVDAHEIAILGRAAFILKPVEKALLKAGIPCHMMGGNSVMEKEEIKDVLAFLKLAVDPYNDIAFTRIANKPTRGLGPTAVDVITNWARNGSSSLHQACQDLSHQKMKGINSKAQEGMLALGNVLATLEMACEMGTPPGAIVEMAMKETGYLDHLKKTKDDQVARVDNLRFLQSFASDYDDLVDFVQEVAIVTDGVEEGEGVRIATIHASKGLEFDHVFLPAWEEGVFPSPRSIDEIPGDIDDPWVGPPIGGVEEERRIAHVAMTRARHGVNISRCVARANRRSSPSRFIKEAGLRASKGTSMSYDNSEGYGGESFSTIKPVKRVRPRRRPAPRLRPPSPDNTPSF